MGLKMTPLRNEIEAPYQNAFDLMRPHVSAQLRLRVGDYTFMDMITDDIEAAIYNEIES